MKKINSVYLYFTGDWQSTPIYSGLFENELTNIFHIKDRDTAYK